MYQTRPVFLIGLLGTGIGGSVADLIYAPRETLLLAEARKLGAPTMNGGSMVVLQTAEQLRLFTGLQPTAERMLAKYALMR